ncbi:uncharacterized protein LOC135837571 [Planococcus citri]|uniref:uncharacterized protein LOC135837571 n=1 Tax=Planococcus citri TaxID=170843 RepID=UPI0031F8898D
MAGDIEDYPFSFMNQPSSLQLLASSEIALTLWQYKYSNSTYPALSSFLVTKFSCEEMLVVPPRFKVKIDERIATIGAELKKWIDFHGTKQTFFEGDFRDAFTKTLKLMVVDSCGGICFKATAINILNSNQFNDVEKYRLACEFCIEDHVEKLWPCVSKGARLGENLKIDTHSLILYWYRRMRLRKTTFKDTLLVKTRLVYARNASNWPAFEYFWNTHSTDREKLPQAILCLKRANGEAIKRMLPSLNRILAMKVFEEVSPQILRLLVPNEKYFQHVHQFWTVVEHTVYEKESSLFKVLHELWKMVFNPMDIRLGLNNTRCEQINEFLMEIWSNATENLKYDVSNHHIRDFFHPLWTSSDGFPRFYGHNMDFMLDLLDKWRNSNKEQIWHKNWRKLILRAKPVYLERFLRVCLPDDDDVEKFKKELQACKRIFELFIEHGMYSDLKFYLNFCSKDQSEFQLQSKRLLELHFDLIMLHDDEKFAKFDEFVGEMFSNVGTDIEAFKFALMSSSKNLTRLHEAFNKDRSTDFKRIIARFVTSEEKLKSLKSVLLKHCRQYVIYIRYGDFQVDQWQELIEYCTANVDEIAAFKRSFNVDAIFLKRLADIRHFFWSERCFKFFDEFFKWYFASETDQRNFKLKKIANYEKIEHIRVMLDDPAYRSTMHRLLMWFFDNDAEKVREFCKKCDFSPPSSPPVIRRIDSVSDMPNLSSDFR